MLRIARGLVRPAMQRALVKAPVRAQCNVKKLNPKFEAVRKLQEQYQKDDGKPIHLKSASDVMIHRITWALCFIGLLLNCKLYLYYILK